MKNEELSRFGELSNTALTRFGIGIPLFRRTGDRLKLKLLKEKAFKSGNVLLWYKPLTA